MAITKTPDISSMNIYEKIACIRKMVEVIRKNKSGFNYKYVSEDEILSRVSAGMDKYRLLLIPGITPQTTVVTPHSYTKTKPAKGGGMLEERVNEVIVNADMTFTWTNLDNPTEQLVVPWTLVGQQTDASQAVGSGLSYLNRYFLLKFFQISTPEDDPDNWRNKKRAAEQEQEMKIVEETIDEVASMITAHLDQTSEENRKAVRSELSAIVKQYARDKNGKPSADYGYISDATTAAKLLADIKEYTGGKKE